MLYAMGRRDDDHVGRKRYPLARNLDTAFALQDEVQDHPIHRARLEPPPPGRLHKRQRRSAGLARWLVEVRARPDARQAPVVVFGGPEPR